MSGASQFRILREAGYVGLTDGENTIWVPLANVNEVRQDMQSAATTGPRTWQARAGLG